ncbi:MAG: hypothetical protein GY821_16150 [Gammaproteobacteria bacterium]|nr:hypothetical protein [Gammaproteobacteria bacterium]
MTEHIYEHYRVGIFIVAELPCFRQGALFALFFALFLRRALLKTGQFSKYT